MPRGRPRSQRESKPKKKAVTRDEAFQGNLGKLQGIQYAVVAELDEYPSIDFDLLAQRIDVTLRS